MIFTFYSYKGGVGRSMALANVAELYRRAGVDVIVVDWDLEAPGLERYFSISQEAVLETPGVIDLLEDYKRRLSLSDDAEEGVFPDKLLESCLFPVVQRDSSGGGALWLLPAGRRGGNTGFERYAAAVRNFDWQDFYQNWEGELFFEWLRKQLMKRCPLVIIDSRTGVTEMGGVCTYQLADGIVMLCAPNHQNLDGTQRMAESFSSEALKNLRGHRPLKLLVVPSRVEDRAEQVLLDDFQEDFGKQLMRFSAGPSVRKSDSFLRLKIPHVPFYAFRETLAVQRGDNDLSRAYIALAREMATLAPEQSDVRWASIGGKRQPYDVFLSYSAPDVSSVELLARHISDTAGLRVWFDRWQLQGGASIEQRVDEGLRASRTYLLCVGGHALEDARLAAQAKQNSTAQVIPLLLPGSSPNNIPGWLRNRAWLDMRSGLDELGALDKVVDGIRRAISTQDIQERLESHSPYISNSRPYRVEDAELFFGFEAEVRQANQLLRERRLLAIVGAAGSGKTSLVQAGIIPTFRTSSGKFPAVSVSVRGGNDPFAALKEELAPARDGLGPEQAGRKALREILEGSGNAAGESTPSRQDPEVPLLLFIDDLEAGSGGVLQRFCDWVSRYPSLHVILATRPGVLPASEAVHSMGVVTLTTPSLEQLIRIIVEPARKRGISFEKGLPDRIASEVGIVPGSLLALSLLLQALWERREGELITHRDYAELGGGAFIGRWADGVYQRLTPEQQQGAVRLLTRLVNIDANMSLRPRSVRVRELGVDKEMGSALAALVREGMVSVLRDESGEETVRLAHDLIVQHWRQLRVWVEHDLKFLRWHQDMAVAALRWQEDPDIVLSGKALAQAIHWSHLRELTSLERSFIQASQRSARRDALKRMVLVVTGVGCVVLGLVVMAVSRTLTTELVAADHQLRQIEDQLELSRTASAQLASDKARLMEELLTLEQDKNQVSESFYKLKEHNAAILGDLKKAGNRVRTLQGALKANTQDLNSVVAQTLAQIESIENQSTLAISQLERRLGESESARKKLEQDKAAVDSKLTAATALLDATRSDKLKLELEKKTTEIERDTAQSELKKVQGQRDAAQSELKAAQNELKKVQGERDTATTDKEAAQRELKKVQGERDTATTERDTARGELKKVQGERDTATTERDTARGERIRFEQELTGCQTALKKCQDQ